MFESTSNFSPEPSPEELAEVLGVLLSEEEYFAFRPIDEAENPTGVPQLVARISSGSYLLATLSGDPLHMFLIDGEGRCTKSFDGYGSTVFTPSVANYAHLLRPILEADEFVELDQTEERLSFGRLRRAALGNRWEEVARELQEIARARDLPSATISPEWHQKLCAIADDDVRRTTHEFLISAVRWINECCVTGPGNPGTGSQRAYEEALRLALEHVHQPIVSDLIIDAGLVVKRALMVECDRPL